MLATSVAGFLTIAICVILALLQAETNTLTLAAIAFVFIGAWSGIVIALAVSSVRKQICEPLTHLSSNGNGFLVRITVRRQNAPIGSDFGIAWYSEGQFNFKGSRTQFCFAATSVERVEEIKGTYFSGERWTLSNQIPNHQVEVVVIDTHRPVASETTMTLKQMRHAAEEQRAPVGTFPPKSIASVGLLSGFTRDIHSVGSKIRSSSFSCILVVFALQWATPLSETLAHQVASLLLLAIVGSYPVGLVWLLTRRSQISRAVSSDPA